MGMITMQMKEDEKMEDQTLMLSCGPDAGTSGSFLIWNHYLDSKLSAN